MDRLNRVRLGRSRRVMVALAVALALGACDGGTPDAEAEAEPAPVVAASEPAVPQGPEPASRKPLFGDLHIHTVASWDSFTFGNRLTLDDAYRFARGEKVTLAGNRPAQLARPLDFAAVTDHVEFFGASEACSDESHSAYATRSCQLMRDGDWAGLTDPKFGELYYAIPPQRTVESCSGEDCAEAVRAVWAKVRAAADAHYERGAFTTFVGYEYSPGVPVGGMVHRNIIFANQSVPELPLGMYELPVDAQLWEWLTDICTGACDVIAIPHNQNYSFGYSYGLERRDGKPYTVDDFRRRVAIERLSEMHQIKGNSECAPGLSTDEDCGFEQIWPVCEEGQTMACQLPGTTVRDGLGRGLKLEAETGVNPFKFGFIGSTDTHNGNPGQTDEWDYQGGSGLREDTVEKRLVPVLDARDGALRRNAGGLAGVWAEENTRESIFAAFKRRETFSTSGTRKHIRLFASFDYEDGLAGREDMIAHAYANGVPMGSDIEGGAGGRKLRLLVQAKRDPMSAPLARLQVVKVWLDGDTVREQTIDIACSDGLLPQNGVCPDNGARVDLSTCARSDDRGADELTALWEDDAFDAGQRAVYYARVLENPTCRWSSLQALADGRTPPAMSRVEPVVRERAWSSPVWYTP